MRCLKKEEKPEVRSSARSVGVFPVGTDRRRPRDIDPGVGRGLGGRLHVCHFPFRHHKVDKFHSGFCTRSLSWFWSFLVDSLPSSFKCWSNIELTFICEGGGWNKELQRPGFVICWVLTSTCLSGTWSRPFLFGEKVKCQTFYRQTNMYLGLMLDKVPISKFLPQNLWLPWYSYINFIKLMKRWRIFARWRKSLRGRVTSVPEFGLFFVGFFVKRERLAPGELGTWVADRTNSYQPC